MKKIPSTVAIAFSLVLLAACNQNDVPLGMAKQAEETVLPAVTVFADVDDDALAPVPMDEPDTAPGTMSTNTSVLPEADPVEAQR